MALMSEEDELTDLFAKLRNSPVSPRKQDAMPKENNEADKPKVKVESKIVQEKKAELEKSKQAVNKSKKSEKAVGKLKRVDKITVDIELEEEQNEKIPAGNNLYTYLHVHVYIYILYIKSIYIYYMYTHRYDTVIISYRSQEARLCSTEGSSSV